MTFFVVKRAANHYWFTALSSSHVCTIKEMKQTHSLVYAGIHVYLHLLYLFNLSEYYFLSRVVVIYELNAATSDEYLSVFYLLFTKTQSTI